MDNCIHMSAVFGDQALSCILLLFCVLVEWCLLFFFGQSTLSYSINKMQQKNDRGRVLERQQNISGSSLFTSLRFFSWVSQALQLFSIHWLRGKPQNMHVSHLYHEFHGSSTRACFVATWGGKEPLGRSRSSSGATAIRLLPTACLFGARKDKLNLLIVHSEGLPCVEVHVAVEGIPWL